MRKFETHQVFYVSSAEARINSARNEMRNLLLEPLLGDKPGFYWQGLDVWGQPIGDYIGPFDTESDAIADAGGTAPGQADSGASL